MGQGAVQVPDRLHGHEGADGGALVVCGAAAIDAAVDDFGLKWLGDGPALPWGDHVQVGEDIQLSGFVIQVHGADVVIKVAGGEAQLLRQPEGLGQGGGGTLAVGLTGEGVLPEAGDTAEAGDGGDESVLVLLKVVIQLFLVHSVFDLSLLEWWSCLVSGKSIL